MAEREQCCPKCKGTSGYRYFETVAAGMSADGWGIDDVPEADGTYGRHFGPSLYECFDCGHKLREVTVLAIRGVTHG